MLRPPPRPFRPAPRLVLPRLARGRATVEVADGPTSGVRERDERDERDFERDFEAAFRRVFTARLDEPPVDTAPCERCFFCGRAFREGEVARWLDYYESRAHEACDREARRGRVHYRGRQGADADDLAAPSAGATARPAE
jgi:hypothetical protein